MKCYQYNSILQIKLFNLTDGYILMFTVLNKSSPFSLLMEIGNFQTETIQSPCKEVIPDDCSCTVIRNKLVEFSIFF